MPLNIRISKFATKMPGAIGKNLLKTAVRSPSGVTHTRRWLKHVTYRCKYENSPSSLKSYEGAFERREATFILAFLTVSELCAAGPGTSSRRVLVNNDDVENRPAVVMSPFWLLSNITRFAGN